MWTRAFWMDVGERAVKTFAQTAGPLIVASSAGLIGIEWLGVLSLSGASALASVLMSISSAPFSNEGTASLSGSVEYTG